MNPTKEVRAVQYKVELLQLGYEKGNHNAMNVS
jgi:hypothetical protein